MKNGFFRDLVVGVIAAQPHQVKNWLLRRHRRIVLGVLFRLERGDIVVSPAGPSRLRFFMKMQWQAHTDYALGTYEPEFLQVLKRRLHPGDTCVDVGGHLGYYSMLMARLVGPKGRVITFEPVPANQSALLENVTLNQLTNVEVVGAALTSHAGAVSLVCPESELLSFHPSIRAYDVKGKRKTINVRSETLDLFLERRKCRPSVIKIDVEGAEIEVLRGAAETLRTIRPAVLVEIHGWGDASNREVLDLFSSLQYSVSIVGMRGHEAFCVAIPNGNTA